MANYYVSPTGNNLDPGTLAQPWATITKAAQTAVAGDIVYIRAGTYRENLAPTNSGTSGNPITFKAYENEEVILSGIDLLNTWTSHDLTAGKNIWKTSLMDWTLNTVAKPAGENFLFIGGGPMIEARWPAIDKSQFELGRDDWAAADSATNPAATTINTPVSWTLNDSDLPSGLTGAYVNFNPGPLWTTWSGVVTASSSGSITFTAGYYSYQIIEGTPYYLWGLYDFLTAPNQWYRNEGTGEVFAWFESGIDPNTLNIGAKRREKIIEFFNRSYITLDGVKVIAGRISTNTSSIGITIKNCQFLFGHVSQYYEVAWAYYSPVVNIQGNSAFIQNCLIESCTNGALDIAGTGSIINRCTVQNACVLGNNEGILMTGSSHNVSRNVVTNIASPRCIKINNSVASKIHNNEFSYFGKISLDEGAILIPRNSNAGSNKTWIYDNIIHHSLGVEVPARSWYHVVGIYSDGNTQSHVIHHNIIYECTNSIALVPDATFPTLIVEIYNNTFDGKFYFQPPATVGVNFTGTVIKNNYIDHLSGALRTDFTLTNNAIKTGTYAGNTTVADPKFDSNYQPQIDSPLRNAGVVIAGITDGYSGTVPTLGALEYQSMNFKAGYVRSNFAAILAEVMDSTDEDGYELIALEPTAGETPRRYRWNKAGGLTVLGSLIGNATGLGQWEAMTSLTHYATSAPSAAPPRKGYKWVATLTTPDRIIQWESVGTASVGDWHPCCTDGGVVDGSSLGSPVSTFTPDYFGQVYFDGSSFWQSAGLTDADWKQINNTPT